MKGTLCWLVRAVLKCTALHRRPAWRDRPGIKSPEPSLDTTAAQQFSNPSYLSLRLSPLIPRIAAHRITTASVCAVSSNPVTRLTARRDTSLRTPPRAISVACGFMWRNRSEPET